MKRFLLASAMGMTVTAMTTKAFADEPAPPMTVHAAPAATEKPTPVAASTAAIAARAPTVAAPAPSLHSPPVALAPPGPATAPPADTATTTPLAARPNPPAKPIALAPASEGLGVGYKLLAIVAIGGAVALYLKKKRGARTAAAAPSKIDILARAGIGVRSQLVVVEVEGTRLLVGMTPSTIQTLAVLQTPEDDGVAIESSRAVAVDDRPELEMVRPANLGDRVRSLLGTDEPVMPRLSAVKSAPSPKPRMTRSNARTPAARAKSEVGDSREDGTSPAPPERGRNQVAGQARGLLLSVDEDT